MILLRHIAIVLLGCGTFALCGCGRELRQARKTAEATGNSEMYQVVDACADDPQKLAAAVYLLENLDGHYTRTFDLIDTNTGEISPVELYRSGITSDNYRSYLDSLGLTIKYRRDNDAQTMTAEYLIRNIDRAFAAWRGNPWSQHYSEDVFRRYILPYRIATEEFSDWRTFFTERYTPMIDTMSGHRDVRGVARLIIRDVKSWFGFHQDALLLKPALTPQEAFAYGKGECGSIANVFVLALRAMGIAATVDRIPVWGTSNGGHAEAVYFDEDGNPVMLTTGNWLAARPPKVYRTEFEPQHRLGEHNIYDEPYYRDVTSDYVATSDIALSFDSVPTSSERPALAVFGNERWRPIIPGERREADGRYVFEQIGRSILYLPVYVDGKSVRVAGRPFHLDPRGNVQYYGMPDTANRVTVDLTPMIRAEDRDTFNAADYYVAYWDCDRWQPTGQPVVETAGIAADGSAERLYSVSGLPNRAIYGIFSKRDGRTYYRRIFRSWNTIPTRF